MRNSFSILTVCTGNICRSPLAEQLLVTQLRNIPEITISSAGTRALVGEPMFATTQEIAHSYGAETTEAHRARQVNETLLESSDLILAMTRDHRRAVVELSPRVTRRVFTVREFARLAEVTTDDVLASEIARTGESPVDRLRAAVKAVTLSRNILPLLADRAEEDVIDPYQREKKVHEASAQQLTPAVDAVVSLLRRSVEGAL
ncbi:arsenate reductase/protein-tyrosine-phosphatase family protein [Corynebacterium comes]|uniref:Low molecular weight protein-tyrosine-phosphatase ptp n=1 Tax=Corynebacterium comes TaxID=2675218 RepID=A0A6B8VII2_9CORY|nr:low molecular weight phosphatase family protein [Corynebacterium comes]QGU05152.1 Low molecular weight protein-tyrosine-phosphatase ptp [Corynebacterium comes]